MEAENMARREAEEEEEKNRRKMEATNLLKKNAPREAEEQEEEKNRREIAAKEQQQQTNMQTQEQQVKNKTEATEVQLSQTLSASQSVGKGSKSNTGRTSMAAKSTVPLPSKMENHFFISHCQSTGGDQANAIYLELERLGFACWYDRENYRESLATDY
jgi:hypothetical protein